MAIPLHPSEGYESFRLGNRDIGYQLQQHSTLTLSIKTLKIFSI